MTTRRAPAADECPHCLGHVGYRGCHAIDIGGTPMHADRPAVYRVDIGGGTAPMPDYTNLDLRHGDGIWRRSILEGIPVADGTLDAVRASHVLEHIPAGEPRLFVFNEVHRVLKPHGTFTVIVPLLVDWHAVADPTHVSFWVEESFGYFDGSQGANADYGMAPWTTLDLTTYHGWEGHWTGRPVK